MYRTLLLLLFVVALTVLALFASGAGAPP